MAATYPIKVEKISLAFKRGSSDKEYHLVLISTEGGARNLLIKRWGKRGSWGQVDHVRFTSDISMGREAMKIHREKTGKGYEETVRGEKKAIHESDLPDVIGLGYYKELGEHLAYLAPDATTEGVVEAAPPGFDELPGGKFKAKVRPTKTVAEVEHDPKQTYADDPLWGAF